MIIGRKRERKMLMSLLKSDKSEFVAVYGRRRVGKTYMIREVFDYQFTFHHTGLQSGSKSVQLAEFTKSLMAYGLKKVETPDNWRDAFTLLARLLSSKKEGKKVVFIDELPWMDTPCSKFINALEHFWNSWATMRKDVIFIVCGSATSWIVSNIVMNYGGLHNRLTRHIYVEPFSLHECEQYAYARGLGMNRRNIIETYMILGGIPYYWDYLQKELSWAQNIDNLFFSRKAALGREYNALYASLFRRPDDYIKVINALGTKKIGMTRSEIIEYTGVNQGGRLTKILDELEQCDFIRAYTSIGKTVKDTVYQLIDNFTLFYFKFMEHKSTFGKNYWSSIHRKPQYNAWSGLAFERVCLQHVEQIKKALGISGVTSSVYSWVYRPKNPGEIGVQIDLLIDRDDDVINLCEMKFSDSLYTITKDYDTELRRKSSVFASQTGTNKAVRTVMVTTYGIATNQWSNAVMNQVVLDDLFEE
ncbi:MAG: ATP-binding protein [Bacteroidales bacterium]|nr:ATP-binding protein [Bacteroidales bacterium]